MAKLKFKKDKNAQHFELNAVQDVKVNGTSVFDGVEANIKIEEEYTITVPSFAQRIKISNNDLTYIKNKKPRTLKIKFSGTNNVINLILVSANSISVDYNNTMNTGPYELHAYFLKIQSEDTEQTGCAFSNSSYVVAPGIPIFGENETFVFKLINGVPTWVQET